ncbi:MAG: serine/threonine-protein kinase [Pirellulales bacterium]
MASGSSSITRTESADGSSRLGSNHGNDTDKAIHGYGAELEEDLRICLDLLDHCEDVVVESLGVRELLDADFSFDGQPLVGRLADERGDPTRGLFQHDPTDHVDEDQTEPLHPEVTKRFLDARFLGAGAFGIVFSAYDAYLRVEVALKILRPSRCRSHEVRSRFLGEAQTAALLTHPGIVRIYDTGRLGPLLYISSAKVSGGSLARYLEDHHGGWAPKVAARFFLGIVDAVQFAHSKATLHRDLKPGNILLEPDGVDSLEFSYRPILTDFGLAKRLDQATDGKNLTKVGGVMGTARYMSPEQARGDWSEYGTTSDIFSLGIILYELLAGTTPFNGQSESEIRRKILEQEPQLLHKLNPKTPIDLSAIACKCLEKDPQYRYQSAHELRCDLQRYLDGEPILARKPSVLRRTWGLARKHPFVLSILLLTGLANIGAVFGTTFALYQERKAKARERATLDDLLSVYTSLMDEVTSGAKSIDDVVQHSLFKTRATLERHRAEMPNDEKVRHQLSVIKHLVSLAHSRMGDRKQSVRERIEVCSMLGDLVREDPANRDYRFQRFFSLLLLGTWMVDSPELLEFSRHSLQTHHLPQDGVAILELATREIEKLQSEFPEDFTYRDALAAIRVEMAMRYSVSDPAKCKWLLQEGINTSLGLWEQVPEKGVYAKHAIAGLAKMARLSATQGNWEEARNSIEKAKSVFEASLQSVLDQMWVAIEYVALLETETEILVALGEWQQAADRCDESMIHLRKIRQSQPAPLLHICLEMRMILHRYQIARELKEEAKILDLELRMIEEVEAVKSEEFLRENFQRYLAHALIPEELRQSLLEILASH